jgi:exosome complex component RRP40
MAGLPLPALTARMSSEAAGAAALSDVPPASRGGCRVPPERRSLLPGDTALELGSYTGGTLHLGGGLTEVSPASGGTVGAGSIVATRAGALRCERLKKSQGGGERLYVHAHQRRYVPLLDDTVLGVVLEKHGESFTVDIGSAHAATLPGVAFDGASRRNRPKLDIGALVHARVVGAGKHVEPELSCMSPGGNGKGWMTGESMFGELKGGYMLHCSLDLGASLLQERSPVLVELERLKLPFEIATGFNGRVWIDSTSVAHTIFISNVIAKSELASVEEIRQLCQVAAS